MDYYTVRTQKTLKEHREFQFLKQIFFQGLYLMHCMRLFLYNLTKKNQYDIFADGKCQYHLFILLKRFVDIGLYLQFSKV